MLEYMDRDTWRYAWTWISIFSWIAIVVVPSWATAIEYLSNGTVILKLTRESDKNYKNWELAIEELDATRGELKQLQEKVERGEYIPAYKSGSLCNEDETKEPISVINEEPKKRKSKMA